MSPILFVFNLQVCNGWKQTDGCDPRGAREPENDKDCNETISVYSSGFCDCSRGKVVKYCHSWVYTNCNEACSLSGMMSGIPN